MKHKIYKAGQSFHHETLKDYPQLEKYCQRTYGGELLPTSESINYAYGFEKVKDGDLFTASMLNGWLDKLEEKGII